MRKQQGLRLTAQVCVGVFAVCALSVVAAMAQDSQGDLSAEILILKKEIELLDAFFGRVEVAFTIGAFAITIFGVLASIMWFSTHLRANEIFKTSKETIDIYNEAMKRISESHIETAMRLRMKYNEEAQEIIGRTSGGRGFINTPTDLSRLDSLYRDIKHYERDVDQATSHKERHRLHMTANCYFILGLREHYNKDYELAIQYWEKGSAAKVDESDRSEIQAICLYWAGMARNNQGKYGDALQQFDAAKRLLIYDVSERRFEIERIELETRHWNVHARLPATINVLTDFHRMVQNIEASHAGQEDAAWVAAKITFGNVLLSAHMEHAKDGQGALENDRASDVSRKEHWLSIAHTQFQEVVDRFQSDDITAPIWAKFGLAQVLWQSGDEGNIQRARELYNETRNVAHQTYLNKFEERSRLVALATEYICDLRLGDAKSAKDHLTTIRNLVSQIGIGAHIYSQFVMRNVGAAVFSNTAEEQFRAVFGE